MASIISARSPTSRTTSGAKTQCFSIRCQAWESQMQLTPATRFTTINGPLLTSLPKHIIIKRVQDTTCPLKSQFRTPTSLLTAQASSTLQFSKTFGFSTTFQAGQMFSQPPTQSSTYATLLSTSATAVSSPIELQENSFKATQIL